MSDTPKKWRLLVHGGCGAILRGRLTSEQDRAFREGLEKALEAGASILSAGESAMDAVEASACALEDDPLFNAGRGSVFTYEGTIEMDASIMDGETRDGGAVAGVTATRNPVRLARAAMERSPHVFLSREGADQFSLLQGLEQADPEYFQTEERLAQLERMRGQGDDGVFDIDVKYGTIGAVALDAAGHVAAATSTGGLTGKRWGRIGDSPIIGAGIYADDRSCAVSATGSGEYFLRLAVAHEISTRLRLADGREPARSVVESILGEVADLGGSGGIIAVTRTGEGISAFNTPGMHRGEASPEGRRIALYGDEPA